MCYRINELYEMINVNFKGEINLFCFVCQIEICNVTKKERSLIILFISTCNNDCLLEIFRISDEIFI